MRFVFVPFSIVAGLIAGKVAQKVVDVIWQLVTDEEAPEAGHREISLVKLVLALVIEGAVFRAVRGLADHGARRSFYRVTGSWPGGEAPQET
jgi:hypothetical protein